MTLTTTTPRRGCGFSVLGFAVVLTLGFSVVELIGGLWANSLALVGDAGHMVTDSASLLFALVANIISRKGVDYNHSFGHGRIEVLAALCERHRDACRGRLDFCGGP